MSEWQLNVVLQVSSGDAGHIQPGPAGSIPNHRLRNVCQHILHPAGAYGGQLWAHQLATLIISATLHNAVSLRSVVIIRVTFLKKNQPLYVLNNEGHQMHVLMGNIHTIRLCYNHSSLYYAMEVVTTLTKQENAISCTSVRSVMSTDWKTLRKFLLQWRAKPGK